LLATCYHLSQEWQRHLKTLDGLCQVNDVTILTFAMNVWRHFRVPTARFVSEMNTGFEQSLDIDFNSHDILLPSRAPQKLGYRHALFH
jgi:hypothetical protein